MDVAHVIRREASNETSSYDILLHDHFSNMWATYGHIKYFLDHDLLYEKLYYKHIARC